MGCSLINIKPTYPILTKNSLQSCSTWASSGNQAIHFWIAQVGRFFVVE